MAAEAPAHPYVVPQRAIRSETDLENWKISPTYTAFTEFIIALSVSVVDKKISDPCVESEATKAVVRMLEVMEGWVAEFPPLDQPMRFGNQAFRQWQEHLKKELPKLLLELLPEGKKLAALELAPYLEDAFGNAVRIDYGTGHEAAFVAFLYCMRKLGAFTEEDYQAMVTRIFVVYLRVMRRIQKEYVMEPAGSHGVWGLDDYHFLPFMWGSAQLLHHKRIKPSSIHTDEVLEGYRNEFMYLDAIAFIKEVKHGGPFHEHSPMLNDISSVPGWEKIHGGFIKMYHGEVLGKQPVIQHFLFGTLLPCTWVPTGQDSRGAPPPPTAGAISGVMPPMGRMPPPEARPLMVPHPAPGSMLPPGVAVIPPRP